MHAHVVRHVLTEEFHALERQEQRVESASAVLGEHGRVGVLAVERDFQGDLRQRIQVAGRFVGSVHHQGDVDVAETAALPHVELGRGRFLGGRAVDDELVGLILHHLLKGVGA